MVVTSELKPSSIKYDEEQIIMEQDIGIDVDIYEMEIYHKKIQVIIGKESKKYLHRGVLWYSIYGIVKNRIKSRLGVIEILAKDFKVYDIKNKTPDFSLYVPIIFSFVNSAFIDKLSPENSEKETKNDDDIEDALTIVGVGTPVKGKLEDTVVIGEPHNLFTNMPYKKIELQEESEVTAKTIRKKYVEERHNNWLQRFMKNPNYEIEYNSGHGDCFFYVIVQAFNQIGKETTVKKLRELLSKEVTPEIYNENKKLYNEIKENQNNLMNKIKDTKIQLKDAKIFLENIAFELEKLDSKELKEKFIKTNKKAINNNTKIKEDSEANLKTLNDELKMDKETEDLIDAKIKTINTFEEYREYIKTAEYWADTWAISTFEWLLDVKFIILNSSKYPDSIHEILECGEKNKNIKGETFKPKYYIITTYNGEHYELVMYKKKGIFNYVEIPYDLRILIVNKCMERNAGLFNKIDDFRNFQSQIGIDPSKNGDIEIKENYEGLYDNSIVFMFYSKSSSTPKPGKGSGEKIPIDKIKEFIPLSKFNDWRRKLDDSWMDIDDPIVLDNKKWASVSHYLWGVQFKDKYPEKYISFSLNSGNKISKNYDLAKKENISQMSSANDELDEFMSKEYTVQRENALRAKFTKPEFKSILMATKQSTLLHFENKNPPKEDKLLMFIRKNIGVIEN
jgi:hypothetical protein